MFNIEKIDIHIDLSKKYFENCNSGIAFITADKAYHRGCAISLQLKEGWRKFHKVSEDYAKLHAALIWHLIEDVNWINNIILCHDEDPKKVAIYLDELSGGISQHISGQIIPLTQFSLPNEKRTSPADSYAKAYRKRGLRPWAWNHGKKLNVKVLDYTIISKYLEKL